MFRRHLLAAVALAPLVACAGTTMSKRAQYVVAAGNAARDFVSVLPASAMTAQIQDWANKIAAAGAAVAANPSAAGAGWAQQAYDAVKALVPVAAPLVASIPAASLALAALDALLPFIAQSAGLVGAPMIASPAVAALPAMTLAEAMARYGAK